MRYCEESGSFVEHTEESNALSLSLKLCENVLRLYYHVALLQEKALHGTLHDR